MDLHSITKKERNMLIENLQTLINDDDLVNRAIYETIHKQVITEDNIFRALLIASTLRIDTTINIIITVSLYDDYIYPNMQSLYKLFDMVVTRATGTDIVVLTLTKL